MASRQRRWWEALLLATNLIVANALAALWLVTFLQPSVLGADRAPSGEPLGSGRAVLLALDTPTAWLAFAASVLLLLWNFAWLVRRRERQPPSNWIVSESPAGPVRIAREAIEASLRQAGENLPEITRLRVQVQHFAAKRVQVTGQFLCAEGQNHLAASQRLRQVLLDRFAQLVHLGDGLRAELELQFQGFAGKLSKHAAELPPVEDPAPFTGPKYPIDDDAAGGNA